MSCSDGGGPAAGRSNGVFDFFQHRSLSLDGKAFPEPIDCKHCWAMPTNRHRSRARPNRRQPADECDLPRQIASRAGPVRNSAALSRFDLGNCCGADLGETPAARSGLGRFVAEQRVRRAVRRAKCLATRPNHVHVLSIWLRCCSRKMMVRLSPIEGRALRCYNPRAIGG
jgi:hypothetical protein